MMNQNSYQETLNKIKATDSFKANTILKMQLELRKSKADTLHEKRKLNYKNIGAIAACFAMILSIGILVNRQLNLENKLEGPVKPNIISNNDDKKDSGMLPKLTVTNESGGMGFEGYMAYTIDELEDGNPWTPDSKLTSMPVFKNLSPSNGDGTFKPQLTGDEMIKKARYIASVMKLNINKVYTEPTKEQIEGQEKKTGEKAKTTPYDAIALCNGVKIEVDSNGLTRVFFEPSISLSKKYSFTYEKTSISEGKDTITYLLKEYSNLIAMKSPSQSLFADYTYDGNRSLHYSAFENSGSLLDRIIGYNFNTVTFAPDDKGKLWIIDRDNKDLSQKVGDYPIITVEEAKKLLLAGNYITTVPEKMPSENYIAKFELVYRTSYYDKVFMPYYKFFVEMPTMKQKNGLKTFGTFYVPAVKGEYLTKMPVWNGEFN